MSLQVEIQYPGMIKVNYPNLGQTISATVKLAGVVFAPAPANLPAGIAFITGQLSDPGQISQVMGSHQLNGKQYLLATLTYYMDGTPIREVDYTLDEIPAYTFSTDYIPTVIGSEEITAGKHIFTVVARFFSLQNPGVNLYDVFDIPFVFDASAISIKDYVDTITPQQIVGENDVKIVSSMLDYVLTQRTEGALKYDIDNLANLYDIDNVPAPVVPYLAKTVGYDYFAGLLGNDSDALREELRFLPEWQKSAGTFNSIQMLLRPLQLSAVIKPLYLDLIENDLISGAQNRYLYTDSFKTLAQSKSARMNFTLTHLTFVPNSITINITAGGLDVFDALWDVVGNRLVVTRFHDGTGTPHVQWLIRGDGTNATAADVQTIFADQDRGGITIVFDQLVKAVVDLRVTVNYQYTVAANPGRNTRLSEFFDINIGTQAKPNVFTAVDYQHVLDVVQRSKPLRTKLRDIQFPAKYADAYAINPYSVSTTGDLSNQDRAAGQNIRPTEVNSGHLITDSLVVRHWKRMIDGFRFSWENGCNLQENRFGIFQSLSLEPSFLDPIMANIVAHDTLLQRGYAFLVLDDKTPVTAVDRAKNLHALGLQELNFKDGTKDSRCKILTDYTAHYQTIRFPAATSPAIQTFSDLLQIVDDPNTTSPANKITFTVDIINSPNNRQGIAIVWDGSPTIDIVNLVLGTSTPTVWDTDSTDFKQYTNHGTPTQTLSLYRFAVQADLDAFLQARPNLSNWPFEVGTGKWYATWDITADFHTYPQHISTHYDFILANHQGDCCCPALGVVNQNTAPLVFSQAVGAAYQNDQLEVVISNVQTNEPVARYRWNGAYWLALQTSSVVTVSLSPAVSGTGWTLPMTLAGTVAYALPPSAQGNYSFRVDGCARKVGDNLMITPTASMQDDFSTRHVHNGEFGPINEAETFLGVPALSLFNLVHNRGGVQQVAGEEYFKNNVTFPCLRITVTPSPQTQFTYDTSHYDGGAFYDDAPGSPQLSYQFYHFPKKIIVQTVAGFDITMAPFIIPDGTQFLLDFDSGLDVYDLDTGLPVEVGA